MAKQLSLFADDIDDDERRPALSRTDRTLVAKAIRCLEAVYLTKGDCLTSPQATRDYLKLRLFGLPSEVFVCLFLDLCEAFGNVELRSRNRCPMRIRRPQLHIMQLQPPHPVDDVELFGRDTSRLRGRHHIWKNL